MILRVSVRELGSRNGRVIKNWIVEGRTVGRRRKRIVLIWNYSINIVFILLTIQKIVIGSRTVVEEKGTAGEVRVFPETLVRVIQTLTTSISRMFILLNVSGTDRGVLQRFSVFLVTVVTLGEPSGSVVVISTTFWTGGRGGKRLDISRNVFRLVSLVTIVTLYWVGVIHRFRGGSPALGKRSRGVIRVVFIRPGVVIFLRVIMVRIRIRDRRLVLTVFGRRKGEVTSPGILVVMGLTVIFRLGRN